MLKQLINFYRVSSPKFCSGESLSDTKRRMKFLKWSTFLAATLGYGMYYVCRLSLNVVKKPIVEEGIFSETELGIIGAVLFFTYAVGKFANGFIADRSNINRLMTTGLLVSALVNLWSISAWDSQIPSSCLPFFGESVAGFNLWGLLRV